LLLYCALSKLNDAIRLYQHGGNHEEGDSLTDSEVSRWSREAIDLISDGL
jgi:hypothetical protein